MEDSTTTVEEPEKESEEPAETEEAASDEDAESLVTEAKRTAEDLKETLQNVKNERAALTKLKVESNLGGNSEAGKGSPVEETPQEYAKKVMAGEVDG